MKSILKIAAAVCLCACVTLHADEGDAELLKAAENPLSSNIISIPFKNNFNTGVDPDNKLQYIHNVEPIYPISLSEDWNLIMQAKFNVVSEPSRIDEDKRINGLADTTFAAFLSPESSSDLDWGVGPIVLLPTATESKLGADKWGVGPTVAVVKTQGDWVLGTRASNIWSFAGSGDEDVNFLTWQCFAYYNLPDEWYLTTSPIITADWEADSDERWTVPVGGGAGKMFTVLNQHVNAQVGAYNNVVSPKGAADWQFRIDFQFLFPKEPKILKEMGF